MGMASMEFGFSATGNSPTINLQGSYNCSIAGTFTATILLQRSFDGGARWRTVDTFSGATEQVGEEPEGALYRFRCSAFTSGDPVCRLGL